MSATIAPAALGRLAKVLALLGSPHDGERAAAAQAADRLVKASGQTWESLLGAIGGADIIELPDIVVLRKCYASAAPYSEREREFLEGFGRALARGRSLSVKQREVLNGLERLAELHGPRGRR